MYGVPVDLPLQSFVGQEFSQICIGSFQVQLHCPDTGWISIEGKWELRDKSGEMIDVNQEHIERKSYQLHRIINVPVTGFVVDPPRSFTLFFETGLRLTVFDDSKQYESFVLYLEGGDILPV